MEIIQNEFCNNYLIQTVIMKQFQEMLDEGYVLNELGEWEHESK